MMCAKESLINRVKNDSDYDIHQCQHIFAVAMWNHPHAILVSYQPSCHGVTGYLTQEPLQSVAIQRSGGSCNTSQHFPTFPNIT